MEENKESWIEKHILVVALVTVGMGIVNKSQMIKEASRMKVEQPESESGMVSGILPIG